MKSFLVKVYHVVLDMVEAGRLLGGAGLVLTLRAWFGDTRDVVVHSKRLPVPLHLRLGSTDMHTLVQIFLHREYDFAMTRTPRTVVDAGANVGYAAVYFATRFPQSTVLAIEPEPGNFQQLQKNTRSLANVIVRCAALWNEEGELSLFDAGEGSWGFRVQHRAQATGQGSVKAMSMLTALREQGWTHIDLLKLDIEGSEVEVLNGSAGWIDHVNVIAAELHDKYRPGCSRAFYNATNGFEFERRIGENVVVMRKSFAPTG
jgi:FkbM family methyltransferase